MGKIRLIALDLPLPKKNKDVILKKIAEYRNFCEDYVFLILYSNQENGYVDVDGVDAVHVTCGTDESSIMYFVPLSLFSNKKGVNIADTVFITAKKNSLFLKNAKEFKINVFDVEKEGAGRDLEALFRRGFKNLS